MAGAGAAIAVAVSDMIEAVSSVTVAVGLGILAANLVALPELSMPGLAFAGKQLLRVGVVLLGFRLVVGDVLTLGPTALLLVGAMAVATLTGVIVVGRLLGVSQALCLLTGTGFAICGASAVAAAQGAVDAEEEDVTAALGLVLLFGTLSIAVLPLASSLLELPAAISGAWIGAAVHDVGQSVAAAEMVGNDALEVAILVKLARVLLLGPVLVVLSVLIRRKARHESESKARPPIVPLFVGGFMLAVGVRSVGVIPEYGLTAIGLAERICFAFALFSLGTDVRLGRLRALGWRPLALGSLAYVAVALMGLGGAVAVLGPSFI